MKGVQPVRIAEISIYLEEAKTKIDTSTKHRKHLPPELTEAEEQDLVYKLQSTATTLPVGVWD